MHQPVRPTFDRAAEHNQPWLQSAAFAIRETEHAEAAFEADSNARVIIHAVRIERIQEAIRKCSRR